MSEPVHIFERIEEMVNEAEALGIPARRLYLGTLKMHEFTDAIARDGASAPYSVHVTENTFRGLKVVPSSQPGMSVGA